MKFSQIILCAAIVAPSAVNAASTPDKMMADVVGPVKTITTEIKFADPDTPLSYLPFYTPELALAGSVDSEEGKLYNAVAFDRDGHFSHTTYILESSAPIDFSSHNPYDSFIVEKGIIDDSSSDYDAYKVEVTRKDGRIVMIDSKDSMMWSDAKYFIYSFNDPLTYTFMSFSDAHFICNALYSFNWFYSEPEIQLEEEPAKATHLKSMVVGMTSGQNLEPVSVSVVEYSDYRFDRYGNWISRKATATCTRTESPSAIESKPDSSASEWTEMRTITYYD